MTVDQRPVESAEVKAGTFVECSVRHRCRYLPGRRRLTTRSGADETVTSRLATPGPSVL